MSNTRASNQPRETCRNAQRLSTRAQLVIEPHDHASIVPAGGSLDDKRTSRRRVHGRNAFDPCSSVMPVSKAVEFRAAESEKGERTTDPPLVSGPATLMDDASPATPGVIVTACTFAR